jgi:glucose-6-phosphate isomerase
MVNTPSLELTLTTRIWQKDYTVWKPNPTEITNRLGWLTVPEWVKAELPEVMAFAEDVRNGPVQDIVLLGMGGSSLAPEVLRVAFGQQPGYPRLHMLDSTVADWVAQLTQRLDIAKTLFLVSSKSGGTIELMSFLHHFWQLVCEQVGLAQAGSHFVAITDPSSPLSQLAAERDFRRIFLNPSDIGGRFSALSYFGIVPAALAGYPVNDLVARAVAMQIACAPTADPNPGEVLGRWLAENSLQGRDKLTFVSSPSLATFGLWAEQLVAESTGKEGKGVLPIATEPYLPLEQYSADRVFVYLRLAGAENVVSDAHFAALQAAGKPTLQLDLADAADLGAEFYRWEFATAVAGAIFQIQPFDQPNVQESKTITAQVLADVQATGVAPATHSTGSLGEFLAQAQPNDYIALLVYTNETPALAHDLQVLRQALSAKTGLPTTFGYGPRYLHSTGQYHKGGPNQGLFIQLLADAQHDLSVPTTFYSFQTLATAQAAGDLQALQNHNRRVLRLNLGADPVTGVQQLLSELV